MPYYNSGNPYYQKKTTQPMFGSGMATRAPSIPVGGNQQRSAVGGPTPTAAAPSATQQLQSGMNLANGAHSLYDKLGGKAIADKIGGMFGPSPTTLSPGTMPATAGLEWGAAPTINSVAGPSTASGLAVGTAPLMAEGMLGADALGGAGLMAGAAPIVPEALATGVGLAGTGTAAGLGAAGTAAAAGTGAGLATGATMAELLPFLFLCWVAREVYGADNPRWREFRVWMLYDAPIWFFRLYLRHGEAFAGWLKGRPLAKRMVRWGMDRILTRRPPQRGAA